METRLLLAARIGSRRRLEVIERTFTDGGVSGWPRRTVRAYSVLGAGVRDGSLDSEWPVAECLERALACARRHNPKAPIIVTYWSPSLFVDVAPTWAVHEGAPSWHQRRAGHISAAATTGFRTKADAVAFAEGLKAKHPGMPVFVLREV